MKYKWNCHRFVSCTGLILAVAMIGTGCGSKYIDYAQDAEVEDIAAANDIFDIEQYNPHIFVNQADYDLNDEKLVFFEGGEERELFKVVRKSDDFVVFKGRTQPVSNMEGYFTKGSFTTLADAGTYYIETDSLGRSMDFVIKENVYDELFNGILQNISVFEPDNSIEGICDTSFGMYMILYSMQCNDAKYSEQLVPVIKYLTDYLLSNQNENGSIYNDYEATAAACGIIALSCDMLSNYETDKMLIDKYNIAADNAWSWLEKSDCDNGSKKSARFFAAASLFKSNGDEIYRAIMDNYLKSDVHIYETYGYGENQFAFYGTLTYLTLNKGIERNICNNIVKSLVNRVEQLCEAAKKDTAFETGTKGVDENMSNLLLLGFANYITPSREYKEIIRNIIQYMGGLNETGECYINSDGVLSEKKLECNGIILFAFDEAK